MRYLVCIVALVVCCGDDERSPECSKTDRHGTYRVSTAVNSGSCGDLGTFVVYLDADDTDDCIVHSEEWSDDKCTLDLSLTCTVFVTGGPSGAATYTLTWHETITQEDSNGDRLSGPVSLNLTGSDGSSCSGTYRFTYTRLSED